jgi:hypothetical protein
MEGPDELRGLLFFARFQHHKRSLDLVEALMANG